MRARVTIQQIEEQLIALDGNTAAVGRSLRISRQAINQRIQKSPRLLKLIDELRETNLDEAENQLMNAIKRGEGWAVCFYLKTQGKKRGYVERSELTGADGGAIQVSTFEKAVLKSYGDSDEQTIGSAG